MSGYMTWFGGSCARAPRPAACGLSWPEDVAGLITFLYMTYKEHVKLLVGRFGTTASRERKFEYRTQTDCRNRYRVRRARSLCLEIGAPSYVPKPL